MPRYLAFFLIFGLGLVNICFATKKPPHPHQKAVLKSDSSTVVVRNLDSAALKSFSKQSEFKYDEEESGPSLWARFWRGFWYWLRHLFSGIDGAKAGGLLGLFLTILEYLLIGTAFAAFIFFIIKMIGIDMANIFRRKASPVILPYTETLENIHEIDFDAQIEKAVSLHNYRLAVRLLYLKCLKQLSDASLIQWQPEKSNSTYINELNNIEQRMIFKLLTRQFEYVWYGEFTIDGTIFKNINSSFQKFKILPA
jgi:hypothetical protein